MSEADSGTVVKAKSANAAKAKPIDVQARLDRAQAAVAVLKTLEILGATMRYKDLARAIGLIPDGASWKASHRSQINDILAIVATSEKRGGKGKTPLQFERIVGKDGKPGKSAGKGKDAASD